MRVNVLFFSVLRDLTGTDRLELELDEGAALADLVASLQDRYRGLIAWEGRLLLAVNGEYADRENRLQEGDEIALMPPVQGG